MSMIGETQQKITSAHLSRSAYLYVRQSTLRQVLENTESTKRQYALRDRAVTLGWPIERVVVIDSDLGQSGASACSSRGLPATRDRSEPRPCRDRTRPGSVASGAQLDGLAPAARAVRAR